MKRRGILGALVAVVVVIGISIVVLVAHNSNASNTGLTSLRLGWQTPWATQGQLTQVLAHTNIPKNNGLNIAYKGFESGAPLNEAALGGQVDALFTADEPAATLLSKSSNWVVIGRLMYNRVSLYVPPHSSITSVAGLKGKAVAVPYGTAAQEALILNEKNAGLTPGTDVTNQNLGIYEQSDLVKDPNATTWGSIDAMAGFDPTPAIFQTKGLIRTIYTDKVVSVIMMSKPYITAHPKAPKDFLAAFNQAYGYYRTHQTQADQWFTAAANLDIPEQALKISASIEPNLSTKNSIRLSFTQDDYSHMQTTADFLYSQGLISKKINMKDNVDLSYLP